MKTLFLKLNRWTDRRPLPALLVLAALNSIGVWASFRFGESLPPGTSLLLTGFLIGTFLLSVISILERKYRED